MTPIEYTTSIPEVGVTHDEIIDVRSPSEFLEDHIPGAINIPVLNDAERIEVGRTYKQQNPFEARKLGAAYIAGNISRFLSTHWGKKDKSYRPYIYCWRGGQRSASLATILSAIGWRVTLLDGGYRTYRLQVLRGINERLDAHRLILLGGLTGTGKTRILHELRMLGEQVLDLEALSCHQGSALGAQPGSTQPTQKIFESHLYWELRQFSDERPVWAECESHRIGYIRLPPVLWAWMKAAPVVEIHASDESRIEYLLQGYPQFIHDPEHLLENLSQARRLVQSGVWGEIQKAVASKDFPLAVARLLSGHYDPSYRGSIEKWFPHQVDRLSIPDLSPATLNKAAHWLIGKSPAFLAHSAGQ